MTINRLPLISIILMCAACSTDGDNDNGLTAPDTARSRIGFAMDINTPTSDSGSRAIVTEKDDIKSFRIFGAQWEGSDPNNSEFAFYTMNGDIVSPAKDGSWTTSTPYYWPDSNRLMSFFAYSPIEIDGWTNTSPERPPEEARYYYAPPADPTKQVDILCSSLTGRINHSKNPDDKVKLWFHHALSQVIFDIRGGNPADIESITLKGLTGCGGYHPTPGDGWWDLYDYANTAEGFRTAYTVNIPSDGSMGDDQRLMVIPQTTPYGCRLEIRFRNGRFESRNFEYKTFNLGAVANIVIHIN